MLLADTAIKEIIIVPYNELGVRVVMLMDIGRMIGYVARKLHAVLRTEAFCLHCSMTVTLIFAMVRIGTNKLERTTTVVLVSVVTISKESLRISVAPIVR